MGDRQKIVILDDDEIFAALLAEMLGEHYDVAVGHNGLQGIALCLGGGVDAVLTDIGMPELDGIQMLAEFKKNPGLASIPVLVVTATNFTHRSRSEVQRFPQVRGMFSKSEKAEIIIEAVKKML
ncbi:MAG: response regulator [Elusimicrobiota bacterium]